jgi:AcrR family transcriptional regulator
VTDRPPSRRDHLVETALALFERNGFRATGIDRILAEAGVAKMTLYHHFGSKDELILAALRLGDQRWRRAFVDDVEGRAVDASARLLAMFDSLGECIAEEGFRGCLFVNAAAEHASSDHPARVAAAEHKRWITGYVESLARDAGAADPAALARQLCVLVEGVLARAHVAGDPGAAAAARDAAAVLVTHAGCSGR